MKQSKLTILFIFIFFILFSSIFYLNNKTKNTLIIQELKASIKELQINFDITTYIYTNDAKSIDTYMSKNKELLSIISQANDANNTKKAILRKQLHNLLLEQYQAMKQKGILQFHFTLANNTSFLRMHKPEKFGDDLSAVRYSVKYTNKFHKPSFGFEQGRVAHAFRNVFPLYYKKKHIGGYEISYTSEFMQKNLLEINKIHSHFLVKKDIFHKKTWGKKDLNLKYINSIEHNDYMFAVEDRFSPKKLKYIQKYLILPNEKIINEKIKKSKKFAIYQKDEDKIKIISFLPIKNIQKNKTAAYIISYTDSPHILSILQTYHLINISSLVFLLTLFYLINRQIISRKKLQQHSKEQTQLLSLFDKGEITLFKWRNNDTWSVEYVSNNVENLTGYSRSDFAQNKIAYASIIDKDDLQTVTDEVTHAVENQTEVFTHKAYKIVTKDSNIKWVHDITSIIKDENGEITHFLGYILDITDTKMLELEIYELNKNLHQEVTKQTSENIKKDKLLQEQSKLADMGEMVGSIAHQWRQPLNSLNINIQNLDDDFEDGLIDKNFIDNFIEKQTQTIQFMSQTIDDFRNFFRVDKIKKTFSVKKALDSTISIQNAQLKNYNISVKFTGKDFKTEAVHSEFLQVLLNIITNAKDSILEQKLEHGKIQIDINQETNTIKISDNAGGVPKGIIGRIFEPYFTTKEQGKGTGMGLYMSKVIIEQNIGGKLEVTNDENGAVFTIKLP